MKKHLKLVATVELRDRLWGAHLLQTNISFGIQQFSSLIQNWYLAMHLRLILMQLLRLFWGLLFTLRF